MTVEAAKSRNHVLTRATSAARVTAGNHIELDVLDELFDLRRGRVVDPAVSPLVEDAIPIRAIDAARALADGGGDDRHVLGEGRNGRSDGNCVEQVMGGHAQAGE